MQAVILAGGQGTRLRPLTYTVPKPVIPLANRPFISYMIEWLAGHGIDEIVMACGFLSDGVRDVLGDEYRGVGVRYVTEPDARGTGGAVKFAEDLLAERFMVLNGDVLTDLDISQVQRLHEERGAKVTLTLYPVDDPSAYGLVRTGGDGEILSFVEKPKPDQIDTDQINAGAYVMEREVIEAMPADCAISFETEVFPTLIGNGLYGKRVEGYWLDIGTPDRYLQATRDILDGTVATSVEPTVESHLISPSLAGEGCEISAGANVGPYASLGAGCTIAEGAVVDHAALHDGVELEAGAVVRDSIVGTGARIRAGAVVEAAPIVAPGEVVEPE